MMSYDFETTTHGKWILAGEHAVLRGHGAIVFPINEMQLTLSYNKSSPELRADYAGASGEDMHLLFWSVLEQGVQILGQSLNQMTGEFHLQSNIPVGVGVGASAALCVAMARWFSAYDMLPQHAIQSFARQLEHLFHGKSSGLDIAGVAATSGVYFQQGVCTDMKLAWQPLWYLSSCKQVGITSHCIKQVQKIWQNNENHAKQIDLKMNDSVIQARQALEQVSPNAQYQLTQAINTAADCFNEWGLVSERLQIHRQHLLEAGALAVKPTGSGGGGYVVSLWENAPPAMDIELIAI